MSKPRWIDAGVFRTLRTATRNRTLTIIAGPLHGSAECSTRTQARELLGNGGREVLAEDGRFRSAPDEGLKACFGLKQPGLATTAVSDALRASVPTGVDGVRLYGPDSKGLQGVWGRKDTSIVRLHGAPDDPASLVLTSKDRKILTKPDSRYQAFLRATFGRTVLFSGFALDDPDLTELLDDVARTYNGHVPPNIALIPAGSADPAAALRANMHYGMRLVEFPPELGAPGALAQLAHMLEELEIPKPATGDPPPGFTELHEAFRADAARHAASDRFDRGDSSGWGFVQAGIDAPREVAGRLQEFLLGDVQEGRIRLALVLGGPGEGKTTLLKRVAWELAGRGPRVFWRELGASLPERYVPAERDDARAVFVLDDAEELAHLPVLLKAPSLQGPAAGKVRLFLAADATRWERSGLDHRIPLHVESLQVVLKGVTAAEGGPLAESLVARERLTSAQVRTASRTLEEAEGSLMDRVAAVCGHGSVAADVAVRVAELSRHPQAALLARAYLATAVVHQHGMSLARRHLAAVLGLEDEALDESVLAPLGDALVAQESSAVRTPHPEIAAAAVQALAPDEDALDEMAIELLETLPEGSVVDLTVFHQPSELIRARRQSPMPPLTLGRFFEAGEAAARHDVRFWFDRGRYEVDYSRWEPALRAFDQALWQRPGDSSEREHNALVQANRARCLAALGRKREALRAVEDGLRHAPRDAALERLYEKLGGRRGGGPHARRGAAGRGSAGQQGGRGRGGQRGDRKGGPGGRGGPGGAGGRGGRGGPGGPGGAGGGERGRRAPPRRGPPAGAGRG